MDGEVGLRELRQNAGERLDLMIAATAHAHGATLHTRNADDLRGLECLISIDRA